MKKGEQNRKKRDADFRKINRLEVVHLVRDEGVAGSIPPLRPAFLDIVPRLPDRLRGSNWKRALSQFRGTGRVTVIGEVAALQMPREAHVGKLLP